MIPQEQPQHMKQIGCAVVNRGCGHEQHVAADDEAGERTVAVRVGVSKPMCFVDDDGRTAGRSDGRDTQ